MAPPAKEKTGFRQLVKKSSRSLLGSESQRVANKTAQDGASADETFRAIQAHQVDDPVHRMPGVSCVPEPLQQDDLQLSELRRHLEELKLPSRQSAASPRRFAGERLQSVVEDPDELDPWLDVSA